MSNTFLLPDLGEGLTEADIVRWLVAEGDTVAVDQPMVEVETAKALVEVPSPYAGTVLILHGAEGETMDVGSPLITIGEAGESGEGSAPVAGTETLAVPPSTGADAAEAAEAVYDVAAGSVLLTGDVLLTQGGNVLAGERMTVDLATGAAQVQGRVRSVLQPGSN